MRYLTFGLLIMTLITIAVVDKSDRPASAIGEKAGLVSATKSETIYGIDISHFQGDLLEDMKGVGSLAFVICKATQGETYTDPKFKTNWEEIKKKGYVRGVYHFFMLDDPIGKQADFFRQVVSDIGKSDIAPIIDIEQGSLNGSDKPTAEKVQVALKKMLDAVESHFSRRPIIYTNYEFAQEYLKDKQFAAYPLWLAEYSKGKKPLIPDAWKNTGYAIWQKSESHTIDATETDFDQFNGSREELVKL